MHILGIIVMFAFAGMEHRAACLSHDESAGWLEVNAEYKFISYEGRWFHCMHGWNF